MARTVVRNGTGLRVRYVVEGPVTVVGMYNVAVDRLLYSVYVWIAV